MEGIALAQGAVLKQEAYDFVVATQTGLKQSAHSPCDYAGQQGGGSYQNQGCVVKLISGIDVDSSGNHLLADLEVSTAACLAEESKVVA